MLIVFDLDGTIADHRHRQCYAEMVPRDWDSYNIGMNDDPVIESVAFIMGLLNLCSPTCRVEIWTGRPERFRDLTVKWLDRHNIQYARLRMRPDDDLRNVNDIKGEWLNEGPLPDFVFDDRSKQAKFWNNKGIICLHVKVPQSNLNTED